MSRSGSTEGAGVVVAAEITSTFASSYTGEVTLAGALTVDAIRTYGKQATGQKFLVTPNR